MENNLNNPNDIVSVNCLTKKYSNVVALNNISISLPKGKIIGLLGPNGCGKTTFIKVLANLLMQYKGTVLINGTKPSEKTKAMVSYLPDRNYLYDKWTVNDAIIYFKDFYQDFNEAKIDRLLNDLNINRHLRFKTLSKGNREKVQLALVLSRDAQLYLFDEPIAGVDPAARDYIFKLILDNYNKEASVIISTHLISEAEDIFEYALFLKNGEIVLSGYVDQIKSEHGQSLNNIFREVFKYA